MITLGIETSCDETAVAVVKDGKKVLSNIISSSLPLHRRFGGIVPEIASRAHLEQISKITERALNKAKVRFKDIGLICVTKNPGLPGALLVGLSFARALSFALKIDILEVDHLKAHLFSNFLNRNKPKFPFIGLVVSGGHTSLFLVRDILHWQNLGQTLDDAVGEAYDKVAKILGLGFPGGPIIERLARRGNPDRIKLSCANLESSFNFSFSGIKTAILYKVRQLTHFQTPACPAGRRIESGVKNKIEQQEINDICASFQKAVVDVLVKKSISACLKNNIKTLLVGGGVSINNFLRKSLSQEAKINRIKLFLPEKEFCLDNASMVCVYGYNLFKHR